MASNHPFDVSWRHFPHWPDLPKEKACGKILPQAFLKNARQIKPSSRFSTRFVNGLHELQRFFIPQFSITCFGFPPSALVRR
jgi:hypothetical protein